MGTEGAQSWGPSPLPPGPSPLPGAQKGLCSWGPSPPPRLPVVHWAPVVSASCLVHRLSRAGSRAQATACCSSFLLCPCICSGREVEPCTLGLQGGWGQPRWRRKGVPSPQALLPLQLVVLPYQMLLHAPTAAAGIRGLQGQVVAGLTRPTTSLTPSPTSTAWRSEVPRWVGLHLPGPGLPGVGGRACAESDWDPQQDLGTGPSLAVGTLRGPPCPVTRGLQVRVAG